MKRNLIILFFVAFLIIACKNPVSKKEISEKNDSTLTTKDTLPNPFDVMDELTAQFENKVQLDTFISYITNQNNVKFIARLYESSNDKTRTVTYAGGGYSFELEVDTNQRTKFIDGKTIIRFSDHSLTCDPDSVFKCEDYGFHVYNILRQPQIIEVAGHLFLYSDVSYWCNGIGCGCNITFIYDLETKRPTFIENYRVSYDGYFISDFDNDNNPDLLVISKNFKEMVQKKGLRFDEFDIRLSWYYYDKGKFKPKKDKTTGKPYSFELFSFVPDYNHSSHGDLVYSITKNNWNR